MEQNKSPEITYIHEETLYTTKVASQSKGGNGGTGTSGYPCGKKKKLDSYSHQP